MPNDTDTEKSDIVAAPVPAGEISGPDLQSLLNRLEGLVAVASAEKRITCVRCQENAARAHLVGSFHDHAPDPHRPRDATSRTVLDSARSLKSRASLTLRRAHR